MKKNVDRSDFAGIDSFDSLRGKKNELEQEIAVTRKKVSSYTERLIQDGARVVAAGAFAFVVSKVLGYFMSSNSGNDDGEHAMANDVPKESGKAAEESQTRENAHKAAENGHHSGMDTALIWLETLTGGLEAAKIVLNQIVEMQEKAKEEKSKEKEEMETG